MKSQESVVEKILRKTGNEVIELGKKKGIKTIDVMKIGKYELLGGEHHNHFWLMQEWLHKATNEALQKGRDEAICETMKRIEGIISHPRCDCHGEIDMKEWQPLRREILNEVKKGEKEPQNVLEKIEKIINKKYEPPKQRMFKSYAGKQGFKSGWYNAMNCLKDHLKYLGLMPKTKETKK